MKVSIDEVFDHFQLLDVDASGKVSKRELERFLAGSDILHTFVATFDTTDTGISWDDGTKGCVVVASIEPGSPADENSDILIGLALASVNGAQLPEGGAQMLRKVWRGLCEQRQITLEFYEPFVVVHDFAHTLDLEMDTSRKKQIPRVTSSGARLDRSPQSPISAFILTNLDKLFRPTHGMGNGVDKPSSIREHLVVVTVRIKLRAYAFASDVRDALDDALFFSAPQHFKLGSSVIADDHFGALQIQSDRSPFRLLAADGPT